MRSRNNRKAYGLGALAAAAVLAIAPFATSQALAQESGGRNYELVVGAGKSEVLDLPEPYSDVMIADPKVADVLPLNSRSVYVVGKQQGSTALTIYGPGRRLIAAANVVVSADIEGFKSRLARILPNERDISIYQANQSLVVSGVVSSPAALQQVLALAESYAPKNVVNMLGVEGTQQVMLSVRFVEMNRSVAKNLRANVNRLATNSNPSIQVFTGDTNLNGLTKDTFGVVSALYNNNLELLLDALEVKGLTKTLAEPTLVANSGDTANFLAGGEFPIPVAQSNTNGVPTITIEYKQFGVALAFTPTILKDGLVNIVVEPEVSAIDPSISVNLGLIQVPGIKVRRAHTTVELRDGESFTVAGLLKDDYTSEIRQYPFIGDVPILGALFRSNGYKRDETELVIVVTPHLVTPRKGGTLAMPGDHWAPPSDFELFLFGAQKASGSRLRPEDRALISANPDSAGVEGPHGHVLY